MLCKFAKLWVLDGLNQAQLRNINREISGLTLENCFHVTLAKKKGISNISNLLAYTIARCKDDVHENDS